MEKATATAATDMAVDRAAEPEESKEKTKEIRDRIKALQAIPEESRKLIGNGDGAFDRLLAATQAELREAQSLHRKSKPISVQQASAKAHLQKVLKQQKDLDETVVELRKQQAELVQSITTKEAEQAAAACAVENAKAELAELAEGLAAEVRGTAPPPPFAQSDHDANKVLKIITKEQVASAAQ